MSVATPTARSGVRSTSTTSRHEPRSTSANAHACPTRPTPTTPTLGPAAPPFALCSAWSLMSGALPAGPRRAARRRLRLARPVVDPGVAADDDRVLAGLGEHA